MGFDCFFAGFSLYCKTEADTQRITGVSVPENKGAVHMGRFFSMDNKFFTFMNKVADLCILNIICLVCCIPIVTAGASITAMYYVTLKMVRNEEAYIVSELF